MQHQFYFIKSLVIDKKGTPPDIQQKHCCSYLPESARRQNPTKHSLMTFV